MNRHLWGWWPGVCSFAVKVPLSGIGFVVHPGTEPPICALAGVSASAASPAPASTVARHRRGRVMGAAMARVADAAVSAFLVNVEPGVRGEDPVGLGVAHANAQAAALIPGVVPALDVLLRQHIIAARRTILGDAADAGYETQ